MCHSDGLGRVAGIEAAQAEEAALAVGDLGVGRRRTGERGQRRAVALERLGERRLLLGDGAEALIGDGAAEVAQQRGGGVRGFVVEEALNSLLPTQPRVEVAVVDRILDVARPALPSAYPRSAAAAALLLSDAPALGWILRLLCLRGLLGPDCGGGRGLDRRALRGMRAVALSRQHHERAKRSKASRVRGGLRRGPRSERTPRAGQTSAVGEARCGREHGCARIEWPACRPSVRAESTVEVVYFEEVASARGRRRTRRSGAQALTEALTATTGQMVKRDTSAMVVSERLLLLPAELVPRCDTKYSMAGASLATGA